MEKALRIISLKDKQSDYSYWMSKSFIDRLYAIELLRNQYIKSEAISPDRITKPVQKEE
jgi:hypothetical protein